MDRALAAVLIRTGPDAAFEQRDYALPSLQSDDGLLHVDLCGVCGSDYRRFRQATNEEAGEMDRQDRRQRPAILGHEIVGTVDRLGAEAAGSWGVKEGDRVFVEAS